MHHRHTAKKQNNINWLFNRIFFGQSWFVGFPDCSSSCWLACAVNRDTLPPSCRLQRAGALSRHICTFPTLRDILGTDEYSVMWRSINDTDLHAISVPQSAFPSRPRRFLRSSSPRTACLFWIVSPYWLSCLSSHFVIVQNFTAILKDEYGQLTWLTKASCYFSVQFPWLAWRLWCSTRPSTRLFLLF